MTSGPSFVAARKRLGTPAIRDLATLPRDGVVPLVVQAVDIREVTTASGDGKKMAFVRIQDDTGVAEAVFFVDAWQGLQKVVRASPGALLIGGRLEPRPPTALQLLAVNRAVSYEDDGSSDAVDLEHWKARALAAEALVARLRAVLDGAGT